MSSRFKDLNQKVKAARKQSSKHVPDFKPEAANHTGNKKKKDGHSKPLLTSQPRDVDEGKKTAKPENGKKKIDQSAPDV